jgi:hypothetical protein
MAKLSALTVSFGRVWIGRPTQPASGALGSIFTSVERLTMNWRSILVGAFLTLIVTVIGGILVVVLTRSPAPEERLVYTIDQPVIFDAKDTKISLISSKISNLGTATARSVVVVLKIDEEISIVDHRTQISSGLAANYETIVDKNNITVNFDSFVRFLQCWMVS